MASVGGGGAVRLLAAAAALCLAVTAAGCGSLPGSQAHSPAPSAAPSPTPPPTPVPTPTPPPVPLDRMVGQLVMAGMNGTTPDAALLQEVESGVVGGVILYGANVTPKVHAAIDLLQSAAAAGGNPPLLISTDQEGGTVSRFSGPPISPRAMISAQQATQQGQATADLLAANGVNVNLAPIADVTAANSFETREGRGFGGTVQRVATLADAFAQGMQQHGVAATAKHFPGIGSLPTDTDTALGHVTLSAADLSAQMQPFRQMITGGVDIVMVANAVYPAIDPSSPAVFSQPVIVGTLRDQLGFGGVVMTDGLDRPPGLGDAGARAVEAVGAGADIALYQPESAGPAAQQALLAAAQSGRIPPDRVRDAYDHVMTLKRRVAGAHA